MKAVTEAEPLSVERAALVSTASTGPSPLMPQVGVLALVPDVWHWRWQPRHHVMSRLARYFTVVWMNPAEPWQDSLRLRNLFGRKSEQTPLENKSFVVHNSSPFLPRFYSPEILAQASSRRRIRKARNLLLARGSRNIVLYLWRPDFAEAADFYPADFSCYHIDDEYSFSDIDRPIDAREAALIHRVGQVFIHSPKLLQKKGGINPHTAFVPNGVDFPLYATPCPEPADLAGIPRPRIGYTGHLKRQLDWPLLMDLAKGHPQWSFVFVGAQNAHPEITPWIQQLAALPNVRFLGSKTVQELAAYPQHFDVCIMPYKRDDYTKYIYPLKLHEYLAGGRPVVGTPIASLESLDGLILLPTNTEQWTDALSQALDGPANTTDERRRRQDLAKQHDWEVLVRKIAGLIAQRLGPDFAQELKRRCDLAAIDIVAG
jgi:glycosyltransferase involved in cell wall biosynthesis